MRVNLHRDYKKERRSFGVNKYLEDLYSGSILCISTVNLSGPSHNLFIVSPVSGSGGSVVFSESSNTVSKVTVQVSVISLYSASGSIPCRFLLLALKDAEQELDLESIRDLEFPMCLFPTEV
jgi:hypothetical protein